MAGGDHVTRVAAYVPDLMDRSKVAAAAPEVTFARSAAALQALVEASAVDVAVVDLSRSDGLAAVPVLVAAGVRVVGFGSHVDTATLDAARATGAEVLARSAFFSRLPGVLA